MNRRKFIILSGATSITSFIGLKNLTRKSIGASFNINSIDSLPKDVNDPIIRLNFSSFLIQTQNITKPVNIIFKVGKNKNLDTVNEFEINLKNETGENNVASKIPAINLTDSSKIDISSKELIDGNNIKIDIQIKIKNNEVEYESEITTVNLDVIESEYTVPNVVTNHHPIRNRSEENVIEDVIGNVDGNIHNTTKIQNSNYINNYAEESAGDGYITFDFPELGQCMDDTPLAFAVTVKNWYKKDNSYIMGFQANEDGNGNLNMGLAVNEGYGGKEDSLTYYIWNRHEEDIRITKRTDFSISDGKKYRIIVNKKGGKPEDIDIWVNGEKIQTESDLDYLNEYKNSLIGAPTPDISTTPIGYFTEHQTEKRAINIGEGIIDNAYWSIGDYLSKSEIMTDYINQPWVQQYIIDNFDKDTKEKYNNIGHGDIILNIDKQNEDSIIGNGVALINSYSTDDDCAVSDASNVFSRHPKKGDTLSWLVKTQDSTPGIATYVKTTNNAWSGYAYYVDREDRIRIRKYTNHGPGDGAGEKIAEENINIDKDEWYLVEAKYPDDKENNLFMALYNFNTYNLSRGSEIASISGTDTEYINSDREGVIGFSNIRDNNKPGKIDWLRIVK